MAKKSALVFGIIFILVGILGFFENPIVGMDSLFVTDVIHNLVHLIIGIILLVISLKSPAKSAVALKIFGIIYLVLAIIGFFSGSTLLGLVAINSADNWLHLVLGIVITALGFMAKDSASAPAPMM
ncbi:MAG: DUF4383 domain-containing protein [Patescibacteria group bacterium]